MKRVNPSDNLKRMRAGFEDALKRHDLRLKRIQEQQQSMIHNIENSQAQYGNRIASQQNHIDQMGKNIRTSVDKIILDSISDKAMRLHNEMTTIAKLCINGFRYAESIS